MSDRARRISIWDPGIVRQAAIDALWKLDPRIQFKNPVMFIVEVGSVLTTIVFLQELAGGAGRPLFTGQVAFWLWFTVLFANFAEAMAEGRGKAQADTLRKTRTETVANRLIAAGALEKVPAASLRRDDLVMVHAASSSRLTGKSSRAWPRSTSRRSPVNRRR
jgi:K+-transporting ATPase ATPase B chain